MMDALIGMVAGIALFAIGQMIYAAREIGKKERELKKADFEIKKKEIKHAVDSSSLDDLVKRNNERFKSTDSK